MKLDGPIQNLGTPDFGPQPDDDEPDIWMAQCEDCGKQYNVDDLIEKIGHTDIYQFYCLDDECEGNIEYGVE